MTTPDHPPPRKRLRLRSTLIAFALTLVAAAAGYAALVVSNSATRLDLEPAITAEQGRSQGLAAADFVLSQAEALGEEQDEMLVVPTARRLRAPLLRQGAQSAVAGYLAVLADNVRGAEPLRVVSARLKSEAGAAPTFAEASLGDVREISATLASAAFSDSALLAKVAFAAAKDLKEEAAELGTIEIGYWPRYSMETDAKRAHARGVAWAWHILWRAALADAKVTDDFDSAAQGPADLIANVVSDPGLFVLVRLDHAQAAEDLREAAAQLEALSEALLLAPPGAPGDPALRGQAD